MNLEIKSYVARHHRKFKIDGASTDAEIYVDGIGVGIIVSVFSFAGDERTDAFTGLATYIDGRIYHARLSRHYHRRWIERLARKFAWESFTLSTR